MIAETARLGKRYRRAWALRDVTVTVPEGTVTGLVGPNGAGKTTLLRLLAGLLPPDAGTMTVLGQYQPGTPRARQGVCHIDQQSSLYRGLRVRDALRVAADLNPGSWDQRAAERRLSDWGIALRSRIGRLSGGQQAQVALTLALARHPRLLLLDESLASLDPVARQDVLGELMTTVAEDGMSLMFSTHVIADLERVAGYLIIINGGQVQLAGPVDDLLASHRNLTGSTDQAEALAASVPVVTISRAGRQAHAVARTADAPGGWSARPVTLEELVLAYLRQSPARMAAEPELVR